MNCRLEPVNLEKQKGRTRVRPFPENKLLILFDAAPQLYALLVTHRICISASLPTVKRYHWRCPPPVTSSGDAGEALASAQFGARVCGQAGNFERIRRGIGAPRSV